MLSLVHISGIPTAIVTLVVAVLAYKLFRKLFSKEEPPPPGPWRFPIVGHLPLLGKDPCVAFMKMREKYGDIFQIQMGSWPTVVVNGKRAIREALQDCGDAFSGRPQFVSSTLIEKARKGVSMTFGPYSEDWKLHHKLAAKVLLEFSNARHNPIEANVQEEVDILSRQFLSHGGEAFDPHSYIIHSVASIIYQIVYGRDKNIRDNKDFKLFLKNADEFTKFYSAGNPVDVLPWLRYFMSAKLKTFTDITNNQAAFRMRKVSELRKTFSRDHIRCVTDALLATSQEETRLSEDRIMSTAEDIFNAGFETVTSTLRWALLLMAAHPDVQERVQTELDKVIGDGRQPGIQDRGKLLYTEAVLHELYRYTALVPLSLPHFTTNDVVLGGYNIKSNTIAFINLYSMSHDKAVWGDPHVFRPERFLDNVGQINKSLLEELLPFSTGRRKCIGEPLARMEVFLFFTGLLQRCSFSKPAEIKEFSMDTRFGLTRECLPYSVKVQLRV